MENGEKKDPRQGTIDALNNYYSRLEKERLKECGLGPPKKRREKPEKLVETACVEWMRSRGWSVEIFEAKATFDPRRQVWRQQSMKAGVCDCLGSTELGEAVAIEFKAKGKLPSFNRAENHKQRQFIKEKIQANVFACVVDSVERLQEIYLKWCELKSDREEARKYLFYMLPETTLKMGYL